MGQICVSAIYCLDCEIRIETLEDEGRVRDERRVTDGKRGERWFDEIWVDVFGFIAIFEDKILEEWISGQRGWEEAGREEAGRVKEDCWL